MILRPLEAYVQQRILGVDNTGRPVEWEDLNSASPGRWVWVDLAYSNAADADEVRSVLRALDFDELAIEDAVFDVDLPKFDDFDEHLLVILHSLRAEGHGTFELDCFLTSELLVTVHGEDAPAIEVLRERLQERRDHVPKTSGEVLARLADLIERGLHSVVVAFDERIESLVEQALAADGDLLEDLMAVRAEVASVRRVVGPQREVLAALRNSESTIIGPYARRRFADVFDISVRTASGLDAARSALAETLDAYRGAEARKATDVTKVLTIYAAIMLPLSLIAGFFGMNHPNLPGIDAENGWIAVVGVMLLVAVGSLAVFVAFGWISPPSARRAGASLGRGLVGVVRTPGQIAGTAYQRATPVVRSVRKRSAKQDPPPR
ncbi:MAG: magnesium transporter [Verrucomicrobiales bacterium]|jgi:magnesium transporter